ncbi:MAG: FecR domain-containing protein, partial [Butyricimonas paravirosa]
PNQLGEANEVTGEVEIKDVDVYSYIAWKNQDVVFVNERLESIMEKIERWYDVSVFFQNDSLKDVRFYGNVERYADIRDLFVLLGEDIRRAFQRERSNDYC